MRVFNLLKMAFTSIKTSKQTIQAMLEYFSLKNRELWSGKTGKGTTITVPNLSKYQIAQVHTSYGYIIFNPQTQIIRGIHGDRSGLSDTQITGMVYGTINGDNITIDNCNWISHEPSTIHSTTRQMYITKIIGIEPVIPTALSNIIGGGTLK